MVDVAAFPNVTALLNKFEPSAPLAPRYTGKRNQRVRPNPPVHSAGETGSTPCYWPLVLSMGAASTDSPQGLCPEIRHDLVSLSRYVTENDGLVPPVDQD